MSMQCIVIAPMIATEEWEKKREQNPMEEILESKSREV